MPQGASSPPDQDDLKRQAAERAVDLVEPGMVVGLGGGTTALFAVRRLATLVRDGALRDIVGAPCSDRVAVLARDLGLPLVTLEDRPTIDLTIDGADEVDPQLRLIKGGGGALLREKIVAQASTREVIVVDASKLSDRLGTHHGLPLEVAPFGWRTQLPFLEALGLRPTLRLDGTGRPVVTDQGDYLLDCAIAPLDDPAELARALEGRAGIVEHGLFIGLATDLIVAGPSGVEHRGASIGEPGLTGVDA
ncbi:MAG TPA: ribose-5-phosphate isomerase RpiA [Candidatus Baltobacteraceae bacterium]|nr:ribose-5-phosphate isomerase RpiA [Candidatus Baltobacteraceae bacterium]